jgi:subtilisin family serine protease
MDSSTPLKSENTTPKPNNDCLSPIIFIMVLVWTTIIAVTRHIITFSSTINPTPSTRWIALGSAVGEIILVAIPLVPLAIFWSNLRYRTIFRAWLLALCLAIFLLPAYLIDPTAAQGQAVFHIIFFIVFFLLIFWLIRRRPDFYTSTTSKDSFPANSSNAFEIKQVPVSHGDYTNIVVQDINDAAEYSPRHWRANQWYLVLLIASISAFPWLAWGALGSFLDTILQFISALLFGLAAMILINEFIFAPLRSRPRSFWADFFLQTLGVGTTLNLIVSATAFGYGGMQLLLFLLLPGLAWILVVLDSLSPNQKPLSSLRSSLQRILPSGILIGLVAAAPMTLIDPDELVLVVNITPGEILSKALRAAFISLLVILVFAILLLIYLLLRRARKESPVIPGKSFSWSSTLLGLSAFVAVAAGFIIYFLSGQPGLYGERMFVIMKDQADVSAAVDISDYSSRRQFVYSTLVDHANTTQSGIRQLLDNLDIPYTPYYLVNAIEVDNNPFLRMYLTMRPDVDRILDSPHLRPLPDRPPIESGHQSAPQSPQWNLTLVGADRVWQDFDVHGEGIIVGQSDSGAQSDHPELAESYRGKDGNSNYNWFDPWNHTTAPIDIGGHGTHTLGTMVGKHTGVAPAATWYACVNLARNLGNPAFYLDCMQFMLAPFPIGGDPFYDGDAVLGAHVINNSWGCPKIEGCDANTFLAAVNALTSAGVFVVASAGNDGPNCDTLNVPPPIYLDAFAVGAIDRNSNLANFSSIGPVTSDGSDRVKPDIVAPGVNVLSSLPNSTYGSFSGTSMAGPHVVGVVALMWSANPALIGDIDRTREILEQSAKSYQGYLPNCPGAAQTPSTAYGYGIIDAYRAVEMALGK